MPEIEKLAGPSVADIMADYRLAVVSREASLLGRKEVFAGKAKFGIFGDGKEVAQLAMARAFCPGDFRSGYYRDQTFMFAIGRLTVQQYFAQLYAHASVEADPASGGRLMNGHFATRLIDDAGNWLPQVDTKNSSSDISPTGGQMPRLLGMAYASKLYRHVEGLEKPSFSRKGNEVAFGTIGNASTSEGLFYEAMNAAAVLQVPMLMSVWDDGYGISVSQEYHTAKGSISEALGGMHGHEGNGLHVERVRGYDYPALLEAYQRCADLCRTRHQPVLLHVTDLTQPQGHSTSGSHTRYKSPERLAWEEEFDCNRQMRLWLLAEGMATEEQLTALETEARAEVQAARAAAWQAFRTELDAETAGAVAALRQDGLIAEADALAAERFTGRAEYLRMLRRATLLGKGSACQAYLDAVLPCLRKKLNGDLLSVPEDAVVGQEVAPRYGADAATVDGREVLLANFDRILAEKPEVFAIGEDVGRIGDVNQGMAGLQAKYGELRVTDTGIREATILGQGIGAALRGLRPIVEIQYLDYLLYALQTMSDDLACLSYRTAGGQRAPLIIRTRGHRLEGMWHSGSPMGMIIHALRGMHVCVPRNMTQAAAFYNTCLEQDDPALIIECLNGYRIKEQLPDNLAELRLPLGVPEVIRTGADLTLVTFGSCCRIALDAAEALAQHGIEVEVIDCRTLLPFDLTGMIADSLRKTSRLLVLDEDVPGGASAFILQQVLERQDGYHLLDSAPRTVTSQAHRPAYGSDGDYFSKSNAEDVIQTVLELMREAAPHRF